MDFFLINQGGKKENAVVEYKEMNGPPPSAELQHFRMVSKVRTAHLFNEPLMATLIQPRSFHILIKLP